MVVQLVLDPVVREQLFLNQFMSKDSLLIVFVKNPQLGKVKTRLAKEIGSQKALKVYNELLLYTNSIAKEMHTDKVVFYSDHIDKKDSWCNVAYQKRMQTGSNLGERMKNAFKNSFQEGYEKVVLIGSDCIEITESILRKAFLELKCNDVVLGPANDGGYYLIAMNKLHSVLFDGKNWGNKTVLNDTVFDLERLNISYSLLETLSDIDTSDDLIRSGVKII